MSYFQGSIERRDIFFKIFIVNRVVTKLFVPFSCIIHAIATKYSSMSSSHCNEVPIIVKIPVIWDVMPCALAYRYQCSGGVCCLQQAFLDCSEMLVSYLFRNTGIFVSIAVRA